ncbi:MAG: deoxyribose-phosphate aldolase [Candidatus Heteroscillospira sp.]|jgi:deoxyribose-phosphate aldolase
MDIREILAKCDHTLLRPDCTWEEIETLCDQGVRYGVASVCIPASYVARAAEYLEGRLPVCTVIGFPNGYSLPNIKAAEAQQTVLDGADEIDMVINLGWVKDAMWDELLEEIREVRSACEGKVLKVIIETCLLTDDEKIKLCEIVSESGADYIKTSTGFSTGGATAEDVELLRRYSAPNLKVKAAGGISSLEDAERFIALGADRLGTSRIVKLAAAQGL